nr:immunoglobulin light chain junction region [Macaca mulatta]
DYYCDSWDSSDTHLF